ncbi:HEAT repeat protein [Methanocalculus alkaliphilus]|uniref:HEAT repeat domain-containing protein n=1 Tax=Methanocalculus alkaliphilus TaxID=768730 RepID=UPI0020A0CA7E|nr:HEAT repeat domain-containing protein [Methanocalculus alkaliphilus]MCP1715382.1 HEAT repeat protein [Methanocalculus alkaliphilus]
MAGQREIMHLHPDERSTVSFEETVTAMLTAPSADEKITHLRSLTAMDGRRAIPHLIAALRDDDKTVRASASAFLTSIGEGAIPELAALLKDQWWIVRYRACEALGEMKSSQTLPHLRRSLQDERDHVRYMAAKGLGSLGNPAVIQDITPLLDDENPYVRDMARRAIQSLRG